MVDRDRIIELWEDKTEAISLWEDLVLKSMPVELLADRLLLGTGVLPPETLERQDLAVAIRQ